MTTSTLRAPFPYFGGKRKIADVVWEALGDVATYVEPFCGSAAVLLARPTEARYETVNDADCHIANVWRSIQHAPYLVARAADRPVNEADQAATHRWLIAWGREHRERVMSDPFFFDPEAAGRWCWGISCWIGDGWCAPTKAVAATKLPNVDGMGDKGVVGASVAALELWMRALAARLRHVRVVCGDWSRVLTPSCLRSNGVTGVFLDAPYAEVSRSLYAVGDCNEVSRDVRAWAIEHGDDPDLRIVLAGYDGEHVMPETWRSVAWKASGGYSNANNDDEDNNARRERLWLSPYCQRSAQLGLF